MKLYTLSFDRKFDRRGKGWRINHKKDGERSTLSCMLGDQEVFVSNSRNLQEKLDKETVSMRDLTVAPLYAKSILTLKTDNIKYETLAVYVEAEAGERLTDIDLKGCGALYGTFGKDNSSAALIIVTTSKDWKVSIYQGVKSISFGSELEKISNKRLRKPRIAKNDNIRVQRVLFLPKNTLITRVKEDRTLNKYEGYVSVSIAQLLSKKFTVLGKPRSLVLDTSILTHKDVTDVRSFLEKKRKVKDFNKEVKILNYVEAAEGVNPKAVIASMESYNVDASAEN